MLTITIDKKDKQYFHDICNRDGYDILCVKDVGGKTEYRIDCNPGMEEEIIEDIACEKQMENGNPLIPVYSCRTLQNAKKRKRLMEKNGTNGFHVLAKDEERYSLSMGEL